MINKSSIEKIKKIDCTPDDVKCILNIVLKNYDSQLSYQINVVIRYYLTTKIVYITTISHFSYKILPRTYQNVNKERNIILKKSSPIIQYLINTDTFDVGKELLIKFLIHNSL